MIEVAVLDRLAAVVICLCFASGVLLPALASCAGRLARQGQRSEAGAAPLARTGLRRDAFIMARPRGQAVSIVPDAQHASACPGGFGLRAWRPEALGCDFRPGGCRPAGRLLGGAMVSGSGTGDRASSRIPRPATRRKFWGWGLEGQGLTTSEIEQLGAAFSGRFGIDRCLPGILRRWVSWTCVRAWRAGAAGGGIQHGPVRPGGAHLRQVVPRSGPRVSPGYAHAPDLVAFPRGEGELGRCWSGAARPASRRSRSAGVPAWSAVSSPMWVTATAASSAWTLVTLPGCWRWTAPRGPRGSRVARWGRWWRRS